MDLNQTLAEYDSLFGVKSVAEITAYLEDHINAALEEPDYPSALSLLSELLGYCRDTSQNEKGLEAGARLLQLARAMNLQDRPEYGTILLNIANADRAFGRPEESEDHYRQAEDIFQKQLSPEDYLFAGLYNNWGLLAEEVSDYVRAEELFLKALSVIRKLPGRQFEVATTLTNLAVAELHQEPPKTEAAHTHLSEAESIHATVNGTDFHYSATLSALGDYFFLTGDFEKAAAHYLHAKNHLEANVGYTEAVGRIWDNYLESCKKAGIEPVSDAETDNVTSTSHTPLSQKAREFYKNSLRPMLDSSFPDYVPYICVGFAGEGSEHFGFDDDISSDHDYEVGVCLWISEQSPAVQIVSELEAAYTELYLKTFGKTPDPLARHGVRRIDSFFTELTGIPEITEKIGRYDPSVQSCPDWFHPTENEISGIAAAVNGEIYTDPEGSLTRIRNFFLKEMPEDWRRKMLATLFHEYCQYAQCNYLRMLKRGDFVTASICKAMAADTAARIVFYLNRHFPPYYKWRMRGVKELPVLPEIADLCRALFDFTDDREEFEKTGTNKTALTFDIISALLLNEAGDQGLIAAFDKDRVFADDYITEIAGLTPDRSKLIASIVKIEWEMFDKVKNEGGRADCQNNWNTFSVMRESQYRTWPDELLASYHNDLLEALATGRNLITEKYARMMESTAPERFLELKDQLPVLDERRIAISEEIIRIQVGWMEDFAEKYPQMAGNARTIHTSDDTPYDTSYETYLRGELSTYSKETLALYGRFIISLTQEGKNLAYLIMTQTALLYGYQSVEDAEEQMKKANW
ncbi:MAG: DUF4125 family protein [Lachnospiraceae bacterium]|nr:DUF4125 family protein [Lachnospiraceae bacterium]